MCHWKLRSSWTVCLSGSLILLLAGCRTTSHAQDGALVGAGLGTAVGAIIGHQSGHTQGGAVIGALTGAVAGSLAGDAQDAREERDAAVAYSRYQDEAAYQASKMAVSNHDLIDMAEARLSDRVILNAVQTRGGQFDLSPSAIIELKRHGVSDEVIMGIQQSNRGRADAVSYRYREPVIIAPPPTVYVAPPPPQVGIVIAPRPYYGYRYGGYGRPHYHHGHRW